jgi:hypothetical protein
MDPGVEDRDDVRMGRERGHGGAFAGEPRWAAPSSSGKRSTLSATDRPVDRWIAS